MCHTHCPQVVVVSGVVEQARAHCPTCQKDGDVEILLEHKQMVEMYTISEGPSEEPMTSLIVQCNTCQGLMIFCNASAESIASQTAIWPPDPEWRKTQPWSREFEKLDREARTAFNATEKASALAQIFKLVFADHGCEGKDFVSSFAALVSQNQLDARFLSADKILNFLERTLGENPPEVNHNDMLDIQNFYLAVRSQLYETPSLIRAFDEQWSGFSGEYFGGDST